MDPISIAANIVSGLIVEFLKEGSKSVVQQGLKIIDPVREKLKSVNTHPLLERVEVDPSKRNIESLEREIAYQMSSDENFLITMERLVESIKLGGNSINLATVLTNLENIENLKTGNIKQTPSDSKNSKQVVLDNVKGVKNIEIGDITQN